MVSHLSIRITRFENDGTQKDEKNHHGAVDKSSKQQVCVMDGKTGPIHLVLVGLMAGRPNTGKF